MDNLPSVQPEQTAQRRVIQCEALAWLEQNPAAPLTSIVTSLPDLSEMPDRQLDGWREWFTGAARKLLRWLPEDGVAIFFQSDVRHEGLWIDKGYLVQRAAEDEGACLLWHKIVCRKPAGTATQGRASYSHLLCFSKLPRAPRRPSADVLPDAGCMPWPRAMGVSACRFACDYLRQETSTELVLDPFCGRGTLLAVAEEFGFETLGLELSVKRCRKARTLRLTAEGEPISAG